MEQVNHFKIFNMLKDETKKKAAILDIWSAVLRTGKIEKQIIDQEVDNYLKVHNLVLLQNKKKKIKQRKEEAVKEESSSSENPFSPSFIRTSQLDEVHDLPCIPIDNSTVLSPKSQAEVDDFLSKQTSDVQITEQFPSELQQLSFRAAERASVEEIQLLKNQVAQLQAQLAEIQTQQSTTSEKPVESTEEPYRTEPEEENPKDPTPPQPQTENENSNPAPETESPKKKKNSKAKENQRNGKKQSRAKTVDNQLQQSRERLAPLINRSSRSQPVQQPVQVSNGRIDNSKMFGELLRKYDLQRKELEEVKNQLVLKDQTIAELQKQRKFREYIEVKEQLKERDRHIAELKRQLAQYKNPDTPSSDDNDHTQQTVVTSDTEIPTNKRKDQTPLPDKRVSKKKKIFSPSNFMD